MSLAATPEGVQPPADRLASECFEGNHVAGDGMVVEVSLHYPPQPRPLLRDWQVTPVHQGLPDLTELGA